MRFIPVVITEDDVALQDTTHIIDTLEARYPQSSVYPETPRQRLTALLLEVYGDEWLLMPAMHYRWNFLGDNRREVITQFGRMILPGWPGFLQRMVGKKLGAIFSGMVPRLGITPDTIPAVEASYEALLDELNAHFKQQAFLLGSRPCIGDYGLVGPLYAHLYRDLYPGRLMRERAPEVARWVERMNDPEPNTGQFLADDLVPETLLPILRRMFREQTPILLDTMRALAEHVEAHPGEKIPRTIGTHPFQLEGVTGERVILPYSQWMWQRPQAFYTEQSGDARETLETFLDDFGGREALNTAIPCPLDRVNNRIVPA